MRVKTQLKIIICYRVYGEINIHKRISTRRHTTRYNSQCHVPVANKQEVIENELKTFGQIVRKFCVPTLSNSIAKDEPVSAAVQIRIPYMRMLFNYSFTLLLSPDGMCHPKVTVIKNQMWNM